MTTRMQDEIKPDLVPFARVLVSNSFQPNQYVVPEFQRPYSWETEQVTHLIGDISASIHNGRSYYYLGALVLASAENDVQKVIDGQQRLSTAQIIISRIWRYLAETDSTNPQVAALSQYFGHDHPALGFRPTLVLGPTDQPFFSRHVINGEPLPLRQRYEAISHEHIAQAIITVDEFIVSELERLENPVLHKTALLKFIDYFSRQVAVLQVQCTHDRIGYQLFRSLNARGKDLSGVDLIKNMIYESTGSDPSAVELWSQAVDPYEDSASADVTDFLRAHWTARRELIRLSETTQAYEPLVLSPEFDAVAFLIELGEDSEIYQAITSSSHVLWNSIYDAQRKEAKRAVEILIDYVVPRQVLPLLMVCVRKLKNDPQELARFVQSFCGWAVRGVITRSWQKITMETASANACIALRDRPSITTEDVYEVIAHMIPNDTEFIDALRLKPFSNRQGRMLLGVIENYIRRHEEEDDDEQWIDVEALTLEHILPQTPTHEDWPSFCNDANELLENGRSRLRLIGNMTLISGSRNRDISNSAYSLKRERFAGSSLNITKRLSSEEEWDDDAIDRRHEVLLDYAARAFTGGIV